MSWNDGFVIKQGKVILVHHTVNDETLVQDTSMKT